MVNKLAVAGPDSVYKQPGARLAGFWDGYWHGLIAPITLIVGLFRPGVAMYEVNNTGRWYDVGFFLGMSSVVGGRGISVRVQPPSASSDFGELSRAAEPTSASSAEPGQEEEAAPDG